MKKLIALTTLFLLFNCGSEQSVRDETENTFGYKQSIGFKRADGKGSLEMVIQSGHSSNVKCIAISPDSKIIASGSNDESIKLWDTQNGVLLKTLIGHTGGVEAVAFSPDGKTLVSGATDNNLKVWDVASGVLLGSIAAHSKWINSIAFSPDGKYFASGADDSLIRIWDAGNGTLIKTLTGHGLKVNSVAYSPDGKNIVSASWDNTVKIWDSQSGELLKTLTGHSGWVYAVAYSPDGKNIISGSEDSSIRIWDAQSGAMLKTLFGHGSWVSCLAYSPDGKTILSGSFDYTVRLWDAQSGALLKTLTGHAKELYGVAFSPNGKTFASASVDKSIILWDAQSKAQLKTFQGLTDSITSVAFSPDGRSIISGGGNKSVKQWDFQSGALQKTYPYYNTWINSVAYHPNGKNIAAGYTDTRVNIFDVNTGMLKTLKGHSGGVLIVTYSPDGKTIASASWDKSIKLWDAQSGTLLKTLEGHTGFVYGLAFSPDGRSIASGSWDDTVRIWDTQSGTLLKTIQDYWTEGVAFNPDGKSIASASLDKSVKIWDVQSGALIKKLTGHIEKVNTAVYSPDGKYIASGSRDRSIKIWNAQSGELIKTLFGHTGNINSISFHPSSKIIVSGSWDGSNRIWNIETGKSVAVIHFDDGNWFVADEDGRFECSDGGKKYVRFVKNLIVYNPEQYWNQFYTPGLLAKITGGEKIEHNFLITQAVDNTPVVKLNEKSTITEVATVTISVNAKQAGNGLGKIFLYHNGRALDENTKGLKINTTGENRTFTVGLIEGENTFMGAAYDKDNIAEGRSDLISITYKPKKIEKPDMYIIAVGVSEYKDINIRLKSPSADAKSISAALKAVALKLYGNVYTLILTDKEANKTRINKELNAILDKVRPMDTVIVFLSGHGITEQNKYHYLSYEADITDLGNTTLSIEEIGDFLKKLPANKAALFLDTCQSGSATKSLGTIAMARGLEERKIIANLAKDRGIAVFSAAAADQSAYEIKALGHGIFTYAMIEALKYKNKITDNGIISISRLLGVVNQLTRELAFKYLMLEQTPTMYIFGDDFAIGK